MRGQLGGGLPRSPQRLRAHKALQVKRLVSREHEIHGPGHLLGQHGERLAFAVFTFKLGEVGLPGVVLAQKEDRRLREGSLELGVANLLAREPVPLAGRLLSALHQAAVREEVLHAGKAGDVLDLIENDQGQDLADVRDGLQAGEALGIVPLGRAGNIEFHLAQQFVVVVDEGNVHFNRLTHTRIGEVLFHALPIALVRQLPAELGEVLLAVGVLNMGQEFGPLAHQVTATAEQITGGAHCWGIDIGHRHHAPAQEHGDLVGVNLIVLGFAPMNRL